MADIKKADHCPYVSIPEPSSPAEMESLSLDDHTRILAQRQEEGARTSLIQALCVMGRFDEALALESDSGRKAEIQSMIDAETAPDDERCECIYKVDVADYARNSDAEPKLEPAPNYLRGFRHWSTRYGQMVYVRRCHLCGHTQTIPEEMDQTHEAHASAQQHAYHAELARGTKVRTYPGHRSR